MSKKSTRKENLQKLIDKGLVDKNNPDLTTDSLTDEMKKFQKKLRKDNAAQQVLIDNLMLDVMLLKKGVLLPV